MYLWTRGGEGEHRAGGKKSFEVQFGFWTSTRAVVSHGGLGIRSKRRWRMCGVALVEGREEKKPLTLFLIICYVGVVWLKI